MAAIRKVIITCAVTGGIHTPSMSPYLPSNPDEIADSALAAAEAGAAVVHLHTRDPKDGRPSQDPEHFEPILQKRKANTDAVLNITTKDKAAFDKIYEGKQGPLVAVDNKAYDPIIELNKFVDALRKKKSS